jgi:hypothetical protein
MSAQDKFDEEYLDDLNNKLEAMRRLLTSWNPTNKQVWEHPLMREVGEDESDYQDSDDDDDIEDDDDLELS